jgi:hypothetical protein
LFQGPSLQDTKFMARVRVRVRVRVGVRVRVRVRVRDRVAFMTRRLNAFRQKSCISSLEKSIKKKKRKKAIRS